MDGNLMRDDAVEANELAQFVPVDHISMRRRRI